jgi:hypothetical protein
VAILPVPVESVSTYIYPGVLIIFIPPCPKIVFFVKDVPFPVRTSPLKKGPYNPVPPKDTGRVVKFCS